MGSVPATPNSNSSNNNNNLKFSDNELDIPAFIRKKMN
jgi:hypothetical protein